MTVKGLLGVAVAGSIAMMTSAAAAPLSETWFFEDTYLFPADEEFQLRSLVVEDVLIVEGSFTYTYEPVEGGLSSGVSYGVTDADIRIVGGEFGKEGIQLNGIGPNGPSFANFFGGFSIVDFASNAVENPTTVYLMETYDLSLEFSPDLSPGGSVDVTGSFQIDDFFASSLIAGPEEECQGVIGACWYIGEGARLTTAPIPLPPAMAGFVVALAGFGALRMSRRKS